MKNDITDVVNKKLSELGFGEYKMEREDAHLVKVGERNIEPSSLGLFAHAFEDVEVAVYVAGTNDNHVGIVELRYGWTHFDGSNGRGVRFRFRNDVWTQES